MSQVFNYHPHEMYGGRPQVMSYVNKLKDQNPDLTVIDIGAAWNPFDPKLVTHTLDINPVNLPNVTSFYGNMNDYETWEVLFEYVEKHGKFDFCNCTHVLEDIAYPMTALRYMPRIAKQGFIAVPSLYWELERREAFRGGHHHRWIFTEKDNKLVAYPKINLIDFINYNDSIISTKANLELRMFWKDTIEYEVINNDYLGPSFEDVVEMYTGLWKD